MNIKELEEIKQIISKRRHITNCFSFYNEILDWIEKEKVDLFLIKNCVFMFYKENSFHKFYYFVNDYNNIILSKELLDLYRTKGEVSLEFTTKNGRNQEKVNESVTNIGFNFYAEYARVISGASAFKAKDKKEEEKDIDGYYELATLKDKKELLEIMYTDFDKISDYLPTENELDNLIQNKSILIRHLDEKIVFIQIYEYAKGTLYSRMTWIAKKYRKPKYTIDFYKGIDAYLRDLEIKDWTKLRSYGWINKSNKNYKINIKFGAKPDGTTCTTYLYKMEGQN